jgi:hypothetical protein
VIPHWVSAYWNYIGGNVAATPVCGALAVTFTVVFRKPIAAWWRRHFGAQADLRDIKKVAEDARQIAADVFEHHTGHAHHLAPPPEPKERM